MSTLSKLVEELSELEKHATEGPVFVGDDEAEDTIAHRNSGLALIDTGRSEDWPIARLCEWGDARFTAALRNAWPEIKEGILDLAAQLEAAHKESEEQARLLGMSAQREAKLIAELEEVKKDLDHWKRMYECAQNANALRQNALDESDL